MSPARGSVPPDSFGGLVADVAAALDEAIPAWRVSLSAAAAEWRRRGVDAGILERAVALPSAPDVDGLLATFASAVQQMAGLEAEAVSLDPALAGAAAFRDPGRLDEASALVASRRARVADTASAGYPDAEHWVLQWPDVGDLLAGELA